MTTNLAGASPVDQPVRPHAQDLTGDVAWLWTHCRALGMSERSDSGLMHHDVALFAKMLHDALRELVALKAMADQFDAMKQDVHDFATAAVLDGIQAEYQRRKPAAWEAARRILGPNAGVSGCLRAPMPEDVPRTAAGSPLDRPVGPVAGA